MQPVPKDLPGGAETGSLLKRLQHCRAELGQSAERLVRLHAAGRIALGQLKQVDQTMAAYFAQTKNPFKLVWSRVKKPGAIRSQRRTIEAGIQALRTFLNEIEQTRPKKKNKEKPPLPAVEPPTETTGLAKRHHVIISGTGRAGTTFLMELLTSLGLDTGYEHYAGLIDQNSQAGLEQDLRLTGASYIVKNPGLCDYLSDLIEDGGVVVDHAFVPIRELSAAARSRARVSAMPGSTGKRAWGGFWDAEDASGQEQTLTRKLFQLITTLAQYEIPTTLLSFPRLVEDSAYLYKKLAPLLGGISFEMFDEIFQRIARPELVSRDL